MTTGQETRRRAAGWTGASLTQKFLVITMLLTGVRIGALFFSDINLGPDETQYWYWAQTPAFGYFSKPPLIAWAIAATTALFGDAPWAVRLISPIAQSVAAVFIFATGCRLFDEKTGFWSGAIWLTLPGVFLSSMLITTDALLLACWTAAIYFTTRLMQAGALRPQTKLGSGTFDRQQSALKVWALAAGLGCALGFAFLAKYAAIYFPLCLGLAFVFARARLPLGALFAAAIVALFLIAPNLVWNANNGFQTVSHTAANANWGGSLFHPAALGDFIIGQFGVFGPIGFALFIFGAVQTIRTGGAPMDQTTVMGAPEKSAEEKFANKKYAEEGASASFPKPFNAYIFLLCFSAPPIIIISVQSFISRAHANWAAVAYPAAAILVAGLAVRAASQKWLKASIGLHFAVGVSAIIAVSNFGLVDKAGFSNAIKRVRGWEAQGEAIIKASEGYDIILGDDREVLGGLLYYARGANTEFRAWDSNDLIDHHYEAFMALDPYTKGRILYVTTFENGDPLINRFRVIDPQGVIVADLKRGRERRLHLFDVRDFIDE
ncbi:MAG: glycosyltransferase family 39 protein [Pseudomonadota bacterium]